jgi:hypothetical protein
MQYVTVIIQLVSRDGTTSFFFLMVICNSLLLFKSLPINIINCIKFYVNCSALTGMYDWQYKYLFVCLYANHLPWYIAVIVVSNGCYGFSVAVGRQSAMHAENSEFASPTLGQHISTFRGYRILFSIRNPIISHDSLR